MPTYVMLTRLSPEAVRSPADVKRLSDVVARRVRRDCPDVRWNLNLAILGPCDYLDVFDAPDEASAARVAAIVRSFGHGQTETWCALTWKRYEKLLSTGRRPRRH